MMDKKLLALFIFLVFAIPAQAQKKSYNCIILDSVFSAIQYKKEQNDFLFPLFRSGAIKTDGDSVFRITQDISKARKIDSVLSVVNAYNRTNERNIFVDDVIFSLDTFNIIVDTFRFFDNSCNGYEDNHYLVVNDYRLLSSIKETSNVIVVRGIGYTRSGAISIALGNTKSEFVIIIRVRNQSVLYPGISILDKYLFDPIEGIILE